VKKKAKKRANKIKKPAQLIREGGGARISGENLKKRKKRQGTPKQRKKRGGGAGKDKNFCVNVEGTGKKNSGRGFTSKTNEGFAGAKTTERETEGISKKA